MILPVFAKAAEIYGSEVAANFNGAADPALPSPRSQQR